MSGSTAITSATTKLSYSATLPATYTATDYAALTWVPIGEISSLGAFGGKSTIVKHIPVDTAVVVKRAGSTDFGTMSIQMARHKGADMTGLTTAFNNRTSTAFKVTYPTVLGDVEYFSAIVAGLQTSVGTADAILQTNMDLELDSPVVLVAGS